MDIGNRISQLRKKYELSQEALGDICGVTRQAISKWEAGLSFPDIEKIVIISQHFDISVGWLLGVEDEIKRVDADKIADEVNRILEEYFSGLSGGNADDEESETEPVIHTQPTPDKRGKAGNIIAWVLIGVMLIGNVGMKFRTDEMNLQINQLQNNIASYRIQTDNIANQLRNEIESLSGANPYVTDFDYSYVSYDPVEDTFDILVSFIPQDMKKSSVVTVHTGNGIGERISGKAGYDESAGRYFASLNLPVKENMSLYLSVDDGENIRGSRIAFLDIYEQVNPVKAALEFSDSEALLLDENGKIIRGFYNFHNFAGSFDNTFLGERITTVKTELLVYYNGNLIDAIEMQEMGGKEQWLGLDLPEYFKNYTFKDNDSLYFRLRLTNNYGREYIPTEDISIRISGVASEVYRGARSSEIN